VKRISYLHTASQDLELIAGDFYLKKGADKIKSMVQSNTLTLDWMKFE